MIIRAFRITQIKYLDIAFTGEGARRYGGRWNSKGTRMVYTAGSLSLATLELLVHIEDIASIYGRYAVIPIEFNSDRVRRLAASSLSETWNAPVVTPETQMLGDAWIRGMKSPVMRVPSAVTEGESNYLLNPAHPQFSRIKILEPFTFQPDARLGSN